MGLLKKLEKKIPREWSAESRNSKETWPAPARTPRRIKSSTNYTAKQWNFLLGTSVIMD